MLDRIQKRKESGFTIVEVMIVLAIAGLIILVVFLAVPALQRNSRNAERNNDASLIGSAVNECLSNRNGQKQQCDAYTGTTGSTTELDGYIDSTKLRQLTTITTQTVAAGATAPAGPGALASVIVVFGSRCDSAGAAASTANASARSVALLFNSENNAGGLVTRCQEV